MSETCVFPGIKVNFESEVPVVQLTYFIFSLGMNTDNKLKALYNALDCHLVQVVPINISGKSYVVFLDEEGKMKWPWVPTLPLFDANGSCYDVIANSFVVVKEDEEENFQPMTECEFKSVETYLRNNVSKAVAWVP